jgi:tRNA dimethylallyltransferase
VPVPLPTSTRIPVIVGPTAGGKSALAVDVALASARDHDLLAEIVTADSIQVYRGLDIGSAKPTPAERQGIPHHLIDIVEPTETFTVANWLARAEATIADIRSRGRLPIVVGGTHLYVKALLDGLFEGPDPDPALREELRRMDPVARRAELERIDPAAAARIHPNDERRTIRALEVFRLTGRPISDHQTQWDRPHGIGPLADAVPQRIARNPGSPVSAPPVAASAETAMPRFALIGLDWPPELLSPRINARVRDMMDRGLLEETRALHVAGHLGRTAREALGYKQLVPFLERRGSLDAAVEQIKIETRRFAKNQRTWLRRLRSTPGSAWIDAGVVPADRWVSVVIAQVLPTDAPNTTS